ncbi:50S ribosomal protein L3 N(5)-glutamine methyltransferase [Candidatus Halobeggiatoa sp. HSG11]|nr:50S ribosomal protein L3 N(5)-glutamine methyltransferase [Candidatus Halobeggiatoa sp. HSG11]
MKINELQTIGDFIRWGSSQFNKEQLFFGHGTDNAIDEAMTLVVYVLHLPQKIPDILWHSKLTYPEKQKILKLFNLRIKNKIPIPYLTKEAWFSNLCFYVDQRVLIPRSPIAELIEQRFEPWIDSNNINSLLDMCTGSGCIAVASSILAFPNATIDAVDVSHDALAVAQKNIDTYGLQINLIQSNLFSNLDNKLYDLIVSNPPYVDAEEIQNMPHEYTHEPQIGLVAGTDGLFFVEQILRDAINYLNPNGVLVVEVGLSQNKLMEKYPDVPFTWLEFQHGGEGVFLLTFEQLYNLRGISEV